VGKDPHSSVFRGRAHWPGEGFLQAQLDRDCRSLEGGCLLEVLSTPRLLPLHPTPWFHGQDMPWMCLSDRDSCIAKCPGALAGGFSRSAHFLNRASWAVGGLEKAWGLTKMAMQICTTPSIQNVTTIVNSIARSSSLPPHLPHNCRLWCILKYLTAHRRFCERTAHNS
jgi:hypothetical protein